MKKLLYLVPAIALLASGCNSAQPAAEQTQNNPIVSPTPTQTVSTNNKTYTDKEYGFSVEYPSDFTLKTNTPFPAEMPNYLGRFGSGVAIFSLSENSIPENSGVMSANVLVSIADSPSGGKHFFSAVDNTQGVPPPEIRKLELEKNITVNGITYGRAVWDGAAAGTQNHVRIYHVYHNNLWYEIQLYVWSLSSGTFSLGSSDPTWQKLESILAGFKFTK